MSTQEVFVQQFARLFSQYNDALAMNVGVAQETRPNAWNELTVSERERLVAAARLALLEIETTSRMEDDSRRYYAKPGEAEWGC
jgi:hypothetical protein